MFFKRKETKLIKTQEECIENLLKLTDGMVDNTIRKLFLIKDIDNLQVSEEDKVINRAIFINTAVKELLVYSDNIKELSKTANHR